MGTNYVVQTFTRDAVVILATWSAPFGEKRSSVFSEFCPRYNVNIFSYGCFPGPCEVIENYKGTGNNLIRVVLKHEQKYHGYLTRLNFSGHLKMDSCPKNVQFWQN